MEENEKNWDTAAFAVNTPSNKNRIYNALMKSEAAKDKENLFEVSERMIDREKENSKKALEELWLLKKSGKEKEIHTIDMLIEYYQKKVDSVRQKEQRLKSIGVESTKLIDEKKKLQQELSSITQELEACVQEINFLRAKQDKLKTKELEIKSRADSVLERLAVNENEVMDSLSNIILTREEIRIEAVAPAAQAAAAPDNAPAMAPVEIAQARPAAPAAPAAPTTMETPVKGDAALDSVYKVYKPAEKSRFPKSIVKTDRGRILGEYYYDPKVYKNARNYVFNGRYFMDQLRKGLDLHKSDAMNENILNDILLMANDIQNRLKTRNNIYLEVSTNEILNPASVDGLIEDIKGRNLDAVDELCKRFMKKVEVMGQNYELMLAEQLSNIAAKNVNAAQ